MFRDDMRSNLQTSTDFILEANEHHHMSEATKCSERYHSRFILIIYSARKLSTEANNSSQLLAFLVCVVFIPFFKMAEQSIIDIPSRLHPSL